MARSAARGLDGGRFSVRERPGRIVIKVLGIDIGGSGIKGAPVDTTRGCLLERHHRVKTPQPATPRKVGQVVRSMVTHFDWRGPIGVAFPAVIKHGRVRTAANIASDWLGTDAARRFSRDTGCPVTVINDADAAGCAEMHFGAGRGRPGVIAVVTFGTGIGSALFVDGRLLPNTELGHLIIRGRDAESWASGAARKSKELGWTKWARRVDTYLQVLNSYVWPDLIIIGGGVSSKSSHFLPLLTLPMPIVPARLLNDAGIIGAAIACEHERLRRKSRRSRGRSNWEAVP